MKLAVMSGASAGGITAAVAAAALCEEFTPASSRMPTVAPNRLYRAWVQDIDIMSLMGTRDLAREDAPVTSLLDSTPLDDIAAEVLKLGNPREKRPWVTDPLKLILTVTNLGGIPYAIEAGDGSAETQTLYHADQADFELRWEAGTPEGCAVGLSPYSAENWPALGEVAKATSAFPMALAPRMLKRSAGIYNNRRWRMSVSDPKPVDGGCQCETDTELKPNWKAADAKQFETLNVDGGVTNNNPFACAHQELCLQDPPVASGAQRAFGSGGGSRGGEYRSVSDGPNILDRQAAGDGFVFGVGGVGGYGGQSEPDSGGEYQADGGPKRLQQVRDRSQHRQ